MYYIFIYYYFIVEHLSYKKIAISNDLLALVDGANNKLVKFFEMNSGK